MNELILFNNAEFGTIRTLTIEDDPWFVGKDVAEALGYSNASKAVSDHVESEDKQFLMVDIADSQNGNVPIGQSKTAFINESGLYSLIFGSKLESAKRFKHWVTSEVLPAIRKTGSYKVNKDYDRMELAKIISSCKSASAVKTISALFDIGTKPIENIPKHENSPKYDNDSVRKWLENYDNSLLQILPTRSIHDDYTFWCELGKFNPVTLSNFSKRIHQLRGLVVRRRRINGELTGFFVQE